MKKMAAFDKKNSTTVSNAVASGSSAPPSDMDLTSGESAARSEFTEAKPFEARCNA